ncbi:uncharacterized protein E5676_scaffold216G00960 [Cucumis melo var. makuwa]|uniref:DUF506 domain-containing protein n=3 Tax=Cucumis melo TaxID=3656 RepID=A0A5D3E2K1_CUCMM|nr:uncharacterized protein LOC103491259 isoform X1 [Cucumis melo]KAA0057415.1 uncharacterized protein E6C27_scaffold280G002910 [Cucumis melo var. makuwa]TYK30114.1 uncharacterized protein E5676_scaffold216G00960 [Cucumis melo var. makuwa]
MPFQMKIQPIDFDTIEEAARFELVKPVVKSKLKRLFERQFPNVLRNSAEKANFEELNANKDSSDGAELEPSSLCLANMVQNFIEDNNEKQFSASRCGRSRCNCFNGNNTDSSEEDLDSHGSFGDSNFSSGGEAWELLKSLLPCTTVHERNLLADTARIVEKNKVCKRKDNLAREIVTNGLLALGYDASICKSHWEKSPTYPAGDYEYIDVIIEGERLLIDIDLRSEFEIARSTKSYKSILQLLPYIFVGNPFRLQRIVSIVSEAAKQSLKKKGMPVPPWRKAEYVKAKWLSPHIRASSLSTSGPDPESKDAIENCAEKSVDRNGLGELETVAVVKEWKPPELKPKSSSVGARNLKIVTGLASVIED